MFHNVDIGSGVLSLPCGYGKTTVALAIAAKLGLRTMIIVHKEFLMNQWIERIKQFCPGASIGIVQKNKLQVDCDFVIAMLQSLCFKEYTLEHFESIGTLFIDEAHHICAAVFSQSMFRLCPRHIFGLSATPDRKDGLTKVLHWFIGPNFFTVKRENQTQVIVKRIDFTCDAYQLQPPTTRNGKICLPNMVTELVEHAGRNQMLVDLIRSVRHYNFETLTPHPSLMFNVWHRYTLRIPRDTCWCSRIGGTTVFIFTNNFRGCRGCTWGA